MLRNSSLFALPSAYMPYDIRDPPDCRAARVALDQGRCTSCVAFSLAMAYGLRACLRDGADVLPSPYRMQDCMPAGCMDGAIG